MINPFKKCDKEKKEMEGAEGEVGRGIYSPLPYPPLEIYIKTMIGRLRHQVLEWILVYDIIMITIS